AASSAASDTCVRHGRQRPANSGLRGTDAEDHSVLGGTEQHHQASQYCQPQQFAHGTLPLYVHQPLARHNLLDAVREVRRQTKFHLIIATEMRRNFHRCEPWVTSQSAASVIRQLFAFVSRNLITSPTVSMLSAASSGISQPNSSSKLMASSTVSRL